MRLATSEQMRECDRRTIAGERAGGPVPGRELMERAGWGVFAALRQHFDHLSRRAIIIFCGPGNNGGDGFVVARLLREAGLAPTVVLASGAARLSADAAEQLALFRASGGSPRDGSTPEACARAVRMEARAASAHPPLLIDALLGTGSKGAPRGALLDAVSWIERLRGERGATVAAIDLPTGVDGDSGATPGEAVHADLTVTMAFVKPGLLFYPGRALAGRVRVVDIGIPEAVADDVGLHMSFLTGEEASALIPRRAPDAYKSLVGRILIVGGSPGLTGAPSMAALAAQRTGSGLITIALPAALNAPIEAKLTEIMTLPCPETSRGGLSITGEEALIARAQRTDVWALGPGLGREEESLELIRRLAARFPGPIVIDADGLTAFRGRAEIRPAGLPHAVLTPHPGEMAALLEGQATDAHPCDTARAYAVSRRSVLVLKGAPTVIASPDGRVWVNPTGNPGLATGGSGDALTGIIASLLGQGLSPAEAARLGVYLHGESADRVAATRGRFGYSPLDVISAMPETIQAVSGQALARPNEAWISASALRLQPPLTRSKWSEDSGC